MFGACYKKPYFCIRFREREQRWFDILTGNGVRALAFFSSLLYIYLVSFSKKKKNKKNFENIWSI